MRLLRRRGEQNLAILSGNASQSAHVISGFDFGPDAPHQRRRRWPLDQRLNGESSDNLPGVGDRAIDLTPTAPPEVHNL